MSIILALIVFSFSAYGFVCAMNRIRGYYLTYYSKWLIDEILTYLFGGYKESKMRRATIEIALSLLFEKAKEEREKLIEDLKETIIGEMTIYNYPSSLPKEIRNKQRGKEVSHGEQSKV